MNLPDLSCHVMVMQKPLLSQRSHCFAENYVSNSGSKQGLKKSARVLNSVFLGQTYGRVLGIFYTIM